MKMPLRVGLIFAAVAASGQAPAFEVASIKPAPPITTEQILARTAHMGMKVDGARVDIGSASLTNLITQAYRVKTYQVAGPDWLATYRQPFDILAKMPDGSTRDQIPEMMQVLLAERFRLAVHRENREHAVYALIVGKNGSKLKEAPSDAPVAFKLSLNPDGSYHFQITSSLAMLADALITYVDRPVLDTTEMKGLFRITLDVSKSEDGTAPPRGTEFFTAVEELGLKLDPRKMPIETIVIDHLEKTPTGN